MKDQENLEMFLKNAQVFVYGCDAGSLGIVINGVLIHLLNDTGDGDGTVDIQSLELEQMCLITLILKIYLVLNHSLLIILIF